MAESENSNVAAESGSRLFVFVHWDEICQGCNDMVKKEFLGPTEARERHFVLKYFPKNLSAKIIFKSEKEKMKKVEIQCNEYLIN